MQPAIYTKLLDSGAYISLCFYLALKRCEGLTFKSLAIMYTARGLWSGMLRPAKTCCVQPQPARLESFDVRLWLEQVSAGTFYVSI